MPFPSTGVESALPSQSARKMRSKINLCALTLFVCLKLCQTAPASPGLEDIVLSKKLKALSKLGEGYVEQEVKKALLGIKEMKQIIEKNEDRHDKILTSLKKTKEENEEAIRLFQDISERLSEAEMQCKQLLETQWDVCRVCLERSCITFYTNSCSQQGLQEFVIKAQEISKVWPSDTKYIEEGYTSEYRMDAQLSQSEGIFSQLISDVGIVFNKSIVFFTSFKKAFDESFQKLFLSDVKQDEPTTAPDREPAIISDYFEHWDFSSLFQGVYEFGQTFFEAMSDILVMMYKNLSNDSQDFPIPLQEGTAHLKLTPNNIECNQNASECLLFQERCQPCYETVIKDCPDMTDIHFKSEAAEKLVNMSAEQYEDMVQLAQKHTDEMFNLVRQMIEKYGWVAEHSNLTTGTGAIFSIDKVSLSQNPADWNVYDTAVEVSIFTSPNVVIRLPANTDIDSPEVIQYIAEKALEYYRNNF